MPSLSEMRRSPWLAGALLLVLAAAVTAPVAYLLGARHWSFYAGLLAIVLLVFGAVENLWQRRPARRRPRRALGRSRLRVVPGGKAQGKGNGHAHDAPDGESDDDEPRWVM